MKVIAIQWRISLSKEARLHVYIHIPFCDSKCGYCGFNSLSHALHYKKQYLESLCADLKNALQNLSALDSVYIGGGTPNTLQCSDYEVIFEILESRLQKHTEITMELNPNLSTDLSALKSLGINRFSIGVQSFYDDKLALLERNHDTKIARSFMEKAAALDVKLSIDLIYDTILDTESRIKNELHLASALGIGHISCYALSFDENSRFYEKNINVISPKSLCYEVKGTLENLGFYQYEVSNYAKTHKSTHNLGYWQYHEYIGVGLGAVGRIKNHRIYKNKNLTRYIESPLSCEVESLSARDIRNEKIFLGLRSEVGCDMELFVDSSALELALQSRACIEKNHRIYALNYFLADELAVCLMSAV